jgi:hypothetical protein
MALVRSSLTRVLLAAALAAAPALAETRGALVERTIDVPRANRIPLDVEFEKAALLSVESINEPRETDIRDARESDPKDATFVLLRFYYRNADYVSHKVKLRAVLLDEKGGVLAEGGRTGTMDAQQTEDTLSFPLKVRTLDWPVAAKLKVFATFLR